MTDREKQIEEIKDAIDSVYGCDCAYFGVEGLAIAEAIYNAGYRKQVESEWAERTFIIFDSEKVCYHCPKCNTTWDTRTDYFPKCGAKMRGGE